MICAEGLESLARMIVDTGAGRNLIKQNAVNSELSIDEKIVLKLTAINNSPLFTMRQVQINILGYPTILNIIPNEVVIDKDAVLGAEFFGENEVNINYVSNCLEIQNKLYPYESTQILPIPARAVTTFHIPIENAGKSEGYIPRLHIGEGIYAGDAIVINCKGKAYINFRNVKRQLRNSKILSDDELSEKSMISFLQTDNFFGNS